MKRDVRLERTYPHPPELVWRALTTPDLLAEWLMPNDFQPAVGHRFTMRTKPEPGFDGIVHLEVKELDAPRRMRWSWKGGPLDTEVVFVLEPAIVFSQPATKLVLEHRGFEGLPAVLVSFIMGSGWGNMFEILIPALLDRLAKGEDTKNLRADCEAKKPRWRWLSKLFAPVLRRAT
jgi:uncharacterized protein YndB with AHSA1/START domain